MQEILKHPLTSLAALVIAVLISMYFPSLAQSMQTPSEIYLSCFQMCIMPILVCSLVKACSSFIYFQKSIEGARKIVFSYFICLFLVIAFGVFFAALIPVGKLLSKDIMKFAGFEYGLKPIYTTPSEPILIKQSLIDIIRTIFTSNIFESLSKSKVMQIIYFSVVLGCAAGYLKGEPKKTFDNMISGLESIFRKIISWIILFLPAGVVLMFSHNFSKISGDVLKFLLPMLGVIVLASFIIVCLLNFVVARKLGIGFFRFFSHLKSPLLITAATGSPLSSMPVYLASLIENVKLDEKLVNLFGPLGLAMFRAGSGFYLACVSVFVSQIFSIPLGLLDYITIIIMSVLASFAAVSASVINIGLLAIILAPVNVPSSLAIILFIAVDPLMDPIRSAINLYVNAVCTSFSLHGRKSDF